MENHTPITPIIPEWLVVESGTAATYFGADFAAQAFARGAKVYRSQTKTGVLNYERVLSAEDIR